MNLSLWEKQSFIKHDVIIVGSGITGLSTAASLKEQRPELDVLVLEKGLLPTGASTKNAGFACFGSVSELLNDIRTLGESGMMELVEKRWKGLKLTEKRLGSNNIDLQVKGGYELVFGKESTMDHLQKVNNLLKEVFKDDVFFDHTEKIKDFGFRKAQSLIYNQLEGQLDTGKLTDSLWLYCQQLGVKVMTGAEVLKVNGNQVITDSIVFESRAVVLCTNAFTRSLAPTDLAPGRGIVLAIKPHKLPFEGTFHYDGGYYYFRDYYDHIIFGGGRNLDLEGETTEQFGSNPLIKNRLLEDLREVIIPDIDFEVAHEWSGIMAFGTNKSPIIEKSNEGYYKGVRLGGMGVAIGSLVGDELCTMVLQDLF
jgi:glycine/D-amino acid oxidase-like deaminating enzyme